MAFKHYPQISKEDIPSMNIENVNAYLRDFSKRNFRATNSIYNCYGNITSSNKP